MARLLLLNGPNLGLLGQREPALYGGTGLTDIVERLREKARGFGHELEAFQSDAEHELIHAVHAAPARQIAFILLNPAAFTHTSIALRDALLAVRVPFIELHLSNVAAREEFRRRSYFADIAIGTIAGFGALSYELALVAACQWLARGQ